LYTLPTIKQARNVIWEGRGKDGIKFLDRIPRPFVVNTHKTNQTIELVNGSVILLTGADNYDALAGTNPRWAFMSEIQNTNPICWDLIIRPILSENGGGAFLFGTPRGHNHLYEMYEKNKENPDWYTQILTVDDTSYEDGTPVITPEMIDAERRAGMSEELIAQEYYCSFESAIQGAYYADELKDMAKENRFVDFEIDKSFPVHTSWDIGVRDYTSIGFWQRYPDGSLRGIYHLEGARKSAEQWAVDCMQVKEKLGFRRWGKHFFPHDVRVQEWGSGRTRIDIMRKAGFTPTIVGNHKIADRIQCTRSMLPTMWLHKTNCKNLWRSLQEYHSEYDEKRGILSTAPAKSWANHGADQTGYLCVGYLESFDTNRLGVLKRYASFVP